MITWRMGVSSTGTSKWQWYVTGPRGKVAEGLEDTVDAAFETVENVMADLRRGGQLQ
jgi:hypothetical protein